MNNGGVTQTKWPPTNPARFNKAHARIIRALIRYKAKNISY